jgi:hypothetical protein
MACEKIGKAYRIRDTNAKLHGEGGLLRSHVGFAKFMSGFLHSPCVTSRYQGKRALHERVRKATLTLAREIEKLAPAVDEEVSPENAEYPWEAAGRVVAPRDHDFSRLSLLREPGGRVLLKLLKQAVADF